MTAMNIAPLSPGVPSTASPVRRPQSSSRTAAFGRISLAPLLANDGFRVMVEDVLGFGLLRTTLDLFREYFYKETDDSKRQLNVPAARERIIREVGCIFSTTFFAGLVALGLGKALNGAGHRNAYHQFIHHDTNRLFAEIAQKSTSADDFLKNLSKRISPEHHATVYRETKASLAGLDKVKPTRFVDTLKAVFSQKKSVEVNPFGSSLKTIVGKLNPKADTLDLQVALNGGKQWFQLDNLIKDTHQFLKTTEKHAGHARWQHEATGLLRRTMRINNWALPALISLGAILTIVVPYLNIMLTRSINKIVSYPGTIGLEEQKRVTRQRQREPWHKRVFPYVQSSLAKGDILPLVLTLLPIPFALGIVNNANLSNGFWRGVMNNPFKKGFFQRLNSMFQFRQGFPFSTLQQISALCASVITARLAVARDQIEFRERLVDTYLGWFLWIVGTPVVKKGFAKAFEKSSQVRLLKQVGEKGPVVFRQMNETQTFLPTALAERSLKLLKRMNYWALGGTILLIGIFEPILAIKWTEYQVRHATAKRPFAPPVVPKPLRRYYTPSVN